MIMPIQKQSVFLVVSFLFAFLPLSLFSAEYSVAELDAAIAQAEEKVHADVKRLAAEAVAIVNGSDSKEEKQCLIAFFLRERNWTKAREYIQYIRYNEGNDIAPLTPHRDPTRRGQSDLASLPLEVLYRVRQQATQHVETQKEARKSAIEGVLLELVKKIDSAHSAELRYAYTWNFVAGLKEIGISFPHESKCPQCKREGVLRVLRSGGMNGWSQMEDCGMCSYHNATHGED